MPTTKAQQKAVNKYMAANYDRVNVTMPKGKKDVIKTHAEACGESVNGFIGRAIDETMERDGAGGPAEARSGAQKGAGLCLSPEALETAHKAAENAGEAVGEFVERAIDTQAKRDVLTRSFSVRQGASPAGGTE